MHDSTPGCLTAVLIFGLVVSLVGAFSVGYWYGITFGL